VRDIRPSVNHWAGRVGDGGEGRTGSALSVGGSDDFIRSARSARVKLGTMPLEGEEWDLEVPVRGADAFDRRSQWSVEEQRWPRLSKDMWGDW
jgi:hypothetical protein